MFAIPKAILEGLHLRPNTAVGLSVEDGKLIVDPQPSPRYSLAQLLAEWDSSGQPSPEDQAWLQDTPAGGEHI